MLLPFIAGGPFEMLDLGEAAGIEPVITTTAQSTASHPAGPGGSPALPACCAPEDMADLIEYCWGNASTTWGQRRIEDGHVAPYKLRYIELGNGKPSSRTASIRAVSGSASISICMCVCVCVCLCLHLSLICVTLQYTIEQSSTTAYLSIKSRPWKREQNRSGSHPSSTISSPGEHPLGFLLPNFRVLTVDYQEVDGFIQTGSGQIQAHLKPRDVSSRSNLGLNTTDIARAKAAGLDATRLLADLHVGYGGAVEQAEAEFASHPGFAEGAVRAHAVSLI
jgi:hypothetical protein